MREVGAPTSSALSVGGGGGEIVVDVSGAVRRPGVYRMPGGARVVDAMQRAGGADASADLEAINRAARLTDGQQVVVPERGSAAAASGAAPGAATGRSASARQPSNSSKRSTESAR